LSEKVFRIDQVIAGKIPTGDDRCRFDATILQNVIKSVILESLGDENAKLAETSLSDFKPCPTFVVATSAADATGPVVLFRSYGCEGFNANECAIWQAACSTSAAPSFFKPMFVDVPTPGGRYIDGGLRYNNPSQLALDEARRIWPTVKRFCLVSIGTGKQKLVEFVSIKDSEALNPEKPMPSFPGWLARIPGAQVMWRVVNSPAGLMELNKIGKACVDMSTSSESAHEALFKLANSRDPDLRFPYYRFNVERGMESIGLQEWKAKVRIGELTTLYMGGGESQRKRDVCAQDLWKPAAIECNCTEAN
jgi:Patatin-like phospholipase